MRKSADHILSLDLCRGLAAICVMFYHITFLFSETVHLFPRGYLCVDFFFLLSGYVIAKSYDGKISSGLSLKAFCVLRIARLWPLVLLTTAIGFAFQIVRFYRYIPDLNPWDLVVSLASILVMFPSPRSPNDILFPFNPAAWSIFFELVSNVIYVVAFRYLVGRALGVTISLSALALVWTAVAFNSLDVGMTQGNFVFGLPRVMFSFFLGVLFYRRRDDLWMLPTTSSRPFFVGLIAAGIVLSIPKISIDHLDGLIDLIAVLMVFPIILRIAERAPLSDRMNWHAWFLGGISYSVYLLQTPLVIGFSALPQLFFDQKIGLFLPWAGFVFAVILPPIAYVTWKYFERPAQRWLIRALLKGEAQAPIAAARQSRADGHDQYTSGSIKP